MLAVDDGIAQGNLNLADVFFLIGTILAFLAGFLAANATPNATRWHMVAGWFALALVALGLFLL